MNTIKSDGRKFKRVLITGVAGSGGSYLAEYIALKHPEVEIHGMFRWHSTTAKLENLKNIKDKVVLHECDLNDISSIISTLEKAEPEAIFHLASFANVRASFLTPLSVLQNNILGTANLFESIRILKMDPFIQHCSTSEVYGKVNPKNVPITEECPINAVNPYSVSKVTQDLLAQSYHLCYGMKIIRTRMFAYINPRREDLFATSFALQVARIEAGVARELLHGNLESIRTLIDVRDAMEAYWVALTRCTPGDVYNIGGNKVTTVGEFLEELKKHATCPIPSRVDPELLRPCDVTLQIPSTAKFESQTGWTPSYSFEESVEYLLNECRNRVKSALAKSATG